MNKYVRYEMKLVKLKVKESKKDYNVKSDTEANAFLREVCQLHLCPNENFVAVSLNSKGGIISWATISIGDISSAIVSPRDLFRFAIMSNAASIIVAHNHPSGDPSPSKEDVAVTKRIFYASEIMGIKLLDSLIIGEDSFTSLKSAGSF